MKQTKRLALYGMLAALALVLSYIEAMVPAFFAVPGMKLGLTNLVVLVALYRMGAKQAVVINFVRIGLTAMLFGTVVSLWYSLAGGLLSGAVMIALKKTGKFQPVTVSVAGGVMHNVGQAELHARHGEKRRNHRFLPVRQSVCWAAGCSSACRSCGKIAFLL